ncbi:MAG TPA: response regulator [Solirubrobacterales bacterium]|nr:response regulator [Solirubrobacterales bacterium]
MSASDEEIHELVRQEAGDCLRRMESNLLALESGDGGAEEIDAILRDAHSVKGSAAMIGWQQATTLASGIEDRMEQAREQGALAADQVDPLLRAVDELGRALQVEPAAEAPKPAASPAPTIRVPAAKVDRMLDVVGETVLYHRRLEHALGDTLRDGRQASEELDMGEQLLDELQDSVIQMRTLPLRTITDSLPRAVRDLASQEGKEVELTIDGAETQLDRVILDGISETIVHVLRNAVAHGIEEAGERESAGKPQAGRVELRAGRRGRLVAIEVVDDGRGVSPELLARAEQEGSLVDILAETGFSTAEEVTDVAGRGVGLDAVKRHVESLGGGLELKSETGRGTEVTLLLPITLALMKVLLFERGGHPFGLPMTSVGRVVAVADTTSLGNRPSLELEGQVVPLSDLGQLIGAAAAPLPRNPPAIVIESPGRRLAVACDELLGEEEVVIKSLGAILSGMPGFLGAAILGDGRIALVLDPNHLLKAPTEAMAIGQSEETDGRMVARVLVVDDQFSARELQRSILETAGHRVEVARDGREALARIGEIADLDLVLTDVQMPEMDGFELLEAIRASEEHGSLPVVIVTTLGDDASRRRGVEAGADAYIVKEEFDQQALLETIERLAGR